MSCKSAVGGSNSLGLPPRSALTPTKAPSQSPTTHISGACGSGGTSGERLISKRVRALDQTH